MLVKAAYEQNFRIRRSKHITVYGKDGRSMTVIPLTPSDNRSIGNVRAQLRRLGVKV